MSADLRHEPLYDVGSPSWWELPFAQVQEIREWLWDHDIDPIDAVAIQDGTPTAVCMAEKDSEGKPRVFPGPAGEWPCFILSWRVVVPKWPIP